MTLRYLLDTNIVSHAMRMPTGPAGSRITIAGPDSVAISVIVLGELLFGFAKNPSANLKLRLDGLLERILVVGLDQRVSAYYGDARATLERRGEPIGQNDLWIAAHTLALDVTLVTDNMVEFRRVEGLRVENWLRS